MPGTMSDPDANTPGDQITVLINRMSTGDAKAGEELFFLLKDELYRQAEGHFAYGAGNGHTLQPTALVHEAWLRLVGAGADYGGREHFLAMSARAMRSILVDHARRRQSLKRGGNYQRVPLDQIVVLFEGQGEDLVALDEALVRLGEHHQRRARVVELRFFGGMTIAETADALEVSPVTVERDWQMARLWLLDALGLA